MENRGPGVRGLTATLGPCLPLAYSTFWTGVGMRPDAWLDGVAIAAGFVLTIAGLLLAQRPGLGRLLATTSLASFFAAVAPTLLNRPGAAFLTCVFGAMVVRSIWGAAPFRPSRQRSPESLVLLRNASYPIVGVWFVAGPMNLELGPLGQASAFVALGLGAWLAIRALQRQVVQATWRKITAWAAVSLSILSAGLQAGDPSASATLLAIPPWSVLLLAESESDGDGWLAGIFNHPARLLVATFLGIVTVGGLALYLPAASTTPGRAHLIDAFFTAVSAACVTGLTVLDTEKDFSAFGQVVIMVLIQVGGLGIMTFATGALALLNRRASLKQERAMAGLLGAEGALAMFTATKQIIAITFATEAAGALILAAAFMTEGDSIGMALWRGLFTSVSAFCNAGFAIQSDNLISYQGNPLVLHTVAFLIIVGGLGPIPVIAIPALFRAKPISLHARLALITTALLLVLPTVLIAAFEWSHTLGHLSFADRIHNAWFQSVTPRTAGFNSIDYTALQPATVVLTILLMYVGGSPGSTAGGVKTTTLAVLVLSVVSVVLGRNEPVLGRRRIGVTSVYRAMAIATMGALSAFVAVIALMLTQQMDPLDLIFEVFSALGTVGLTVGATSLLDDVGKIVIMACMFAGRVGPLTLFLLLQDRPAEEKWNYPTEETPVG